MFLPRCSHALTNRFLFFPAAIPSHSYNSKLKYIAKTTLFFCLNFCPPALCPIVSNPDLMLSVVHYLLSPGSHFNLIISPLCLSGRQEPVTLVLFIVLHIPSDGGHLLLNDVRWTLPAPIHFLSSTSTLNSFKSLS